jgi:hypothetical protein
LKLYYSPGTCSLAVHIALEEAGMAFEIEHAIPEALLVLHGSMVARPAVQKAMAREGLRVPLVEGAFQKRTGVA